MNNFFFQACIDYDGWLNIKIEHSLNCGTEKYCPRGNIALKSIRAGAAVVDQIQFNKGHIEALKVFITLMNNISANKPLLKPYNNLQM